jgi:hypothetical protein
MKTLLTVLLLSITISITAQTQTRTTSAASATKGMRFNAYGNYIFDDRVDSYYDANNYYKGKVKAGFQWGLGFEYMVHPMYGIELSYLREDTKAPLNNLAYPVKPYEYDLAINYIFLSGTRYFRKPGGKVEGFGGLGAGVGIFNAKDNVRSSNLTKFSWQLRGGAIIWASDNIGIRLQAQLQSAVQAFGGGLYLGTGGVGAGVNSYSSIMQFGLGGGLVFKFGK